MTQAILISPNIQRIIGELKAAIEALENENAELRAAVDNRKKLTAAEVARMRRWHTEGWSQAELADAFDVNDATISRIVRGIYWRSPRLAG